MEKKSCIILMVAFTLLVSYLGGRAIARDEIEECKAEFKAKNYTRIRGNFDVTGRWRVNHDYSQFASHPLPIISVVREGKNFGGSLVGFDRAPFYTVLASFAQNVRLLRIKAVLSVERDVLMIKYQYERVAFFSGGSFAGMGSCCGLVKDNSTIIWNYCHDNEAEKYLAGRKLRFRWERMP